MSTLPERINFPAEEEKVLELWKKLDAFKRSLELSKDKPEVLALPALLGQPAYDSLRARLCSTLSTTALRSRRVCRTTATSLQVRHCSLAAVPHSEVQMRSATWLRDASLAQNHRLQIC